MFLSLFRASIDDRSPWGDFWFEPVTARTSAGSRVSPETAMQLSAVFRAVALLSGHFAMLPLRMRKDGKRITNHWLQALFRKPNGWQHGFEWRQMVMGHLLLRGNAFNRIMTNGRGQITALTPMHPDRIKIELLPNGNYRYRLKNKDGTEEIIPPGEVWHLRGLSSDGMIGLSVIECARESMGLSLAAQSYGARFFANDAKPSGGWVEFPGKFADKAAREVFRETVQAAQSGMNHGKLAVFDQGMKYHEVGVTNEDAQFLETRKFQIAEIARWFGVPPHKLGDLEKATFSNIEQQALEYIQDGLQIWTENWESSIEADLLADDSIEIDFDFKKLMRGDAQSRSTYYHNGILDGWLVRNEARDEEGLERLDGLDEPLMPLNMVEVDDVPDPDANTDEEDQAGDASNQEDATENGGDNARLRAMIEANASRLSRRIVKDGKTDAALIAEAMAIPLERAKEWVHSTVGAREPWIVENITASLIELGTKP